MNQSLVLLCLFSERTEYVHERSREGRSGEEEGLGEGWREGCHVAGVRWLVRGAGGVARFG